MALSRKASLSGCGGSWERGWCFGVPLSALCSLFWSRAWGFVALGEPQERLSCSSAWVLIALWRRALWTWLRAEPLAYYVGVSPSACQCRTSHTYWCPVWPAGSPRTRSHSHEFHRWVHTLLINTSRSLDWEVLKLKRGLLLHGSKRSPVCFVPLWARCSRAAACGPPPGWLHRYSRVGVKTNSAFSRGSCTARSLRETQWQLYSVGSLFSVMMLLFCG